MKLLRYSLLFVCLTGAPLLAAAAPAYGAGLCYKSTYVSAFVNPSSLVGTAHSWPAGTPLVSGWYDQDASGAVNANFTHFAYFSSPSVYSYARFDVGGGYPSQWTQGWMTSVAAC